MNWRLKMSVDVTGQLRVLGEHLDNLAPTVDADEVLSRIGAYGGADGGAAGSPDAVVEAVVGAGSLGPVRRRRYLLVAAAVIVAVGLLGVTLAKGRPLTDPVDGHSTAPDTAPTELTLFPAIGEYAGPSDFGTIGTIASENPERISALVARREANSLRGSLWITVTASTSTTVAPAGTAPADPGVQTIDIHGRRAQVWTEPFEVPAQHVRFDGAPVLEIAGVDALAFMQTAGPGAVRIGAPDTDAFTLEIGDLPEGYEVIVNPFREPRGVTGDIRASISVGGTDTSEGNYVGVELSNPLPASAAYNTTLTAVEINGRPGWVGSGAGHYVIWEPAPGTFATAGGTESADESIALARSVRFVDRATWAQFYGVEGIPPSPQEAPSTTQPNESVSATMPTIPITIPLDPENDVPYGPLDYATTDRALLKWPDATASEPAATTTGYGMYVCDGGYGTKVLRVDPSSGPAHAYSGTLCVFIGLSVPRVDAITMCATTTDGDNYARCQRRTDRTETSGAGAAVTVRATTEQQTAMAAFPTATALDGPDEFTFDLGAAIGPEDAVDFRNDTAAVTITTSTVADGVDTPGVCYVIEVAGATAHGCAGHDLLATGLAYGAFQDGDGPIEIVGLVPDEVTTITIGDTTLTPSNNVWHHTALAGSALTITAAFSDGHTNATR